MLAPLPSSLYQFPFYWPSLPFPSSFSPSLPLDLLVIVALVLTLAHVKVSKKVVTADSNAYAAFSLAPTRLLASD